MQKYLFTVLVVLFGCKALGQRTVPDFGRITLDELRLASCPFEPDATAMKLFDVEQSEFDYSYYDSKIKTERRVRLKIFNEKGYQHASIKIPYYSKRGVSKIKDLKGTVYNLDESGKMVIQKLEKKDFFKTKSKDNIGEIDFTFPNVKPGSVIEFSYVKVERNIIQIDPWSFQDDIPTAYSSISIITPQESRIKEKIYGADSVEHRTEKISGGRVQKTFFKENIPSFVYEPFMSSYRDNLLRIVFMLIPVSNAFIDALTSPDMIWKFAGSHFLDSRLLGGQIDKDIPGTEGLIDSAKKIRSVPGRIKFLYDSIRRRIPGKLEQTLEVEDLAEAWNNKSCTSSEINLILLNLLKKSGVAGCPILVSTRGHGKINTDFPSVAQFNGVDVLAVDSSTVYSLDASLKWQSYQNPPYNVLNREGFMLSRGNMKWVKIDDDRPLIRQSILVSGMVTAEGKIEGILTSKFYDYAKIFVLDSADEEESKDQFVHNHLEGLKVISQKQTVPENDSDPLEQQIEFNFEPQGTGEFFFVNPEFFSSKRKNPFLSSTRNTDIDFGCNQQFTLTLLLNLPASYEVESLPKNFIVRAPDSSFFFRRYATSDSTSIYLTQSFEIKRSVFGKEEYSSIQEFFKKVYSLKAEEIILKKK